MTLFLIAHKVRGERAFDIAEPMDMPDGPWWIIPTSGHRAYPFWTHALDNLFAYTNVGDPPASLRDHYPQPETIRTASLRDAQPRPEDL